MQERPSILTKFAGCLDRAIVGYHICVGLAGPDVPCVQRMPEEQCLDFLSSQPIRRFAVISKRQLRQPGGCEFRELSLEYGGVLVGPFELIVPFVQLGSLRFGRKPPVERRPGIVQAAEASIACNHERAGVATELAAEL